MQATTDKATAVRLLAMEHTAVKELISVLSDDEKTRPDTIRHGLYPDQKLSFKDLLAHLMTYEVYTLEAIEDWKQGLKHWISDALDSDEGSIRVHYDGIDTRRGIPLPDILEQWEQTQAELMRSLNDLTEEEWRGSAPYETVEPTDLGGMVEAILVQPPRPLYRHLPVHIPDVGAYVRRLKEG
jgi:hypothetical protein